MKILLYGKNSEDIAPLVQELGMEIVNSNPEVVISYGGDGTLLSAERLYPGIPKLPIRNSLVCKKCSDHKEEVVLKALLNGQLKLKEYKKLQTNVNGQDLLALNDFVIRNSEQIHIIRFKIRQDSFQSGILIGDGIVIATSFGSTGYFQSITRKFFNEGGGVAFNNLTEKRSPLYFGQDDQVEFQLVRGKAALTFDNDSYIFHIPEGTTLSFKLSGQVARIYEGSSLRCPNCQIIRN